MRANFLSTNFLKTPRGPGHPGKIPLDIPDSSLRNPRKTNFRGTARSFWPPPLRVEDPHPTGRSPDPKIRSRPGKPNQKKGPKRKVHESRPFFVNSGVFPWENKHDSYIELLFWNAPAKSS